MVVSQSILSTQVFFGCGVFLISNIGQGPIYAW